MISSLTTSRLLQTVLKNCSIAASRQLKSQISRKMVVQYNVKNYEEFLGLVADLEAKKDGEPIHVLFSGDKDADGKSWCPYCEKAEPVIHDVLENVNGNSHFVHVELERPYWKDVNCPFRKDPNTKLIFLPTLLRWKAPQRLDGEKVSNKDLVQMIFEDDE